ncbi:MAG: phosphoadenylyl-sulfate reductase [Methylococcales bacterium]
MNPTEFSITQLSEELKGKGPRIILKKALQHFDNIAVSFSGAEDVALVDLAIQLKPDIRIFTLDTGRLHPETYRFLDKVRKHYNIPLDVLFPNAGKIEALVRDKGLFSFFEEGHKECCGLRKVEPLSRHLSQFDAWITGQRRDQSTETRQDLTEIEIDTAFSTDEHTLIKFNPLANWSSNQVWDHIAAYDVPFNPLHRHGYRSIGCEPCTRPTLPNQHEREGRWWWEENSKKECGLHAGNIKE